MSKQRISEIDKELKSFFEQGVAEFAIDVISDAQLNSRVDEGKYRGSWRVSKGNIDRSTGERIDNEDVLKAKLINSNYFDTIYINNVAEYSGILEAKDSTLKNAIFRAVNK